MRPGKIIRMKRDPVHEVCIQAENLKHENSKDTNKRGGEFEKMVARRKLRNTVTNSVLVDICNAPG